MWQLIVAEILKALLPYLKEMLEKWLARDLEKAARQLEGASVDDATTDLFDRVLSFYSFWNPLNWRRRYQIAAIRDAITPYNYQFYVMASNSNPDRPSDRPAVPFSKTTAATLRSIA